MTQRMFRVLNPDGSIVLETDDVHVAADEFKRRPSGSWQHWAALLGDWETIETKGTES